MATAGLVYPIDPYELHLLPAPLGPRRRPGVSP